MKIPGHSRDQFLKEQLEISLASNGKMYKRVFTLMDMREDVVCYRQEVFLPEMQRLLDLGLQERTENGDIIPKEIPVGETRKILMTHDESTFNANDGKRQMWIQNDSQSLRKKSKDRGIIVSEFLTPRGWLAVPEHISADGLPRRQATEYLEYGPDNYRSSEKIVQHTLEIAISIFERAFPGKQAVFLFDNASRHNAYASDALLVENMNLGPGGKQAILCDGFIHAKSLSPQSMVFPENYPDATLRGKAKGCKPTCSDSTSQKCCARQCLRLERDSQAQKGSLQEGIEACGHLVLFYPKFHCELNFIEFFWDAAKRHA